MSETTVKKPADADMQRVAELMRDPWSVFVFGSNLAGVHGAGAAKEAREKYGARSGVGEGLSGRSYAIPTKRTWREPLTLEDVAFYVERFLRYAEMWRFRQFVVTKIGCGYAGFTEAQIAPLFADAPDNCVLPNGWRATPEPEDAP